MPLVVTDRLQPRLLTESVASMIRSAILAGHIVEGETLRESKLSRQLQVSRNTVREAAQILVGARIVEHKPHRGFSVVQLDQEDLRDAYRLRMILELGALNGLGDRVAQAVPAAREALDSMAKAGERRDWQGLFEADLGFHLSVIQVAGSERVARAFRDVMSELQIGLAVHDRSTTGAWVESHEPLLEAMEAGSEERLRSLLEDHLADSEARVLGTRR